MRYLTKCATLEEVGFDGHRRSFKVWWASRCLSSMHVGFSSTPSVLCPTESLSILLVSYIINHRACIKSWGYTLRKKILLQCTYNNMCPLSSWTANPCGEEQGADRRRTGCASSAVHGRAQQAVWRAQKQLWDRQGHTSKLCLKWKAMWRPIYL